MKTILLSLKGIAGLFLLLIMLITNACGDDELEPDMLSCDNTNYTYTNDIDPIMRGNCAASGCHDGVTSLSDYSTYQGVFDDRFVLKNGIERGLEQLTNGRAQLTQNEKDLIVCWVIDGAPQ